MATNERQAMDFWLSGIADNGEGIDIISSLPDEVLVHILSFLPTKHAVGTRILSHRWQYLFTGVTNLDFDESLMFRHNGDHSYPRLKASCTFKDFVDRVLPLCKSPRISKFRLKCEYGFDCSNLNAWITFALLHDVAVLDVSTHEYSLGMLPSSLYTSRTLVELKLYGRFDMKFPEPVQLPYLKSMQLFNVEFSDPYSLNRLIAGCPLLEDLVVGGYWEDVEDINISSARLTSLTMDFSDSFGSLHHRSSVVLDLPNLVHFEYFDRLARSYSLMNLNSLEEARIEVLLDMDNPVWSASCSAVLGLLYGVSNAKHLFICGKCLEGLDTDEYTLPTFCNLRRLEFGWSKYLIWRHVLCQFLDSAPMLEDLNFSEGLFHRKSDSDEYSDKNFWARQRKTPVCLSSHVKTIMIDSFHGFGEEVKIARYLLRHGKVLEKLILDYDIQSSEDERELKKLLKAKRASKECIIN